MAKYYFFKTMNEKTRNRLRALSGQTFEDGSAVDPTLNVSADKEIRSMYPLGTHFGTNRLSPSSGFLDAGDIYVLGIRESDLKDTKHKAPADMQRAFEVFIGTSSEPFREEEAFEEPARDSLLSRMKKNKDFVPPTITKDGFHVDEDTWYLLLRNLTNQVNTMMIGPTGSGKTELVMLACKKLGIKCTVYDMGSMHDPISGLLGVHRLQEGGQSVFDYAAFTKSIAEPGIVLLDELSRAPVTTNNILFPCLDSRRTLPVEIAGGHDCRSVEVHPECCFIATANVGSEYTGTMSMDRALVGRFFPLELGYLPKKEESSVLCKRTGISKVEAENVVRCAETIRNLYTKQELSVSVSTRETLMAAELIADGWSVLKALENVFLPLFEGTKADGERGIVAKVFTTR